MRASNGGTLWIFRSERNRNSEKHHISALSVSTLTPRLTSNSYAADFSVDFPLKENPWRAALRRRHTQWQKDIALLSVAFSSALQGALRMLGSSVLCGSLAASERFKAGTDAKPSHRQRRSALQAGIFIQSRFEWREVKLCGFSAESESHGNGHRSHALRNLEDVLPCPAPGNIPTACGIGGCAAPDSIVS